MKTFTYLGNNGMEQVGLSCAKLRAISLRLIWCNVCYLSTNWNNFCVSVELDPIWIVSLAGIKLDVEFTVQIFPFAWSEGYLPEAIFWIIHWFIFLPCLYLSKLRQNGQKVECSKGTCLFEKQTFTANWNATCFVILTLKSHTKQSTKLVSFDIQYSKKP